MHQIRFRLRGPTSKGRGNRGRERERGRIGEGEKGERKEPPPLQISGYATGLSFRANNVKC